MDDKPLLKRYLDERDSRANPEAGGEAADDLGAFGWLRGLRSRSPMLELRRKNGNILAVGYGWLERMEFDPSAGITLSCAGQRIRIVGRNLNAELRPNVRLFEGIARHRVTWVQESDRAGGIEAPDHATIIDSIEW